MYSSKKSKDVDTINKKLKVHIYITNFFNKTKMVFLGNKSVEFLAKNWDFFRRNILNTFVN